MSCSYKRINNSVKLSQITAFIHPQKRETQRKRSKLLTAWPFLISLLYLSLSLSVHSSEVIFSHNELNDAYCSNSPVTARIFNMFEDGVCVFCGQNDTARFAQGIFGIYDSFEREQYFSLINKKLER